MELANSMRGITENIISSYNARVGAVGDLIFDTHKTLRKFTSDRQRMAKDQSQRLASFTKGLSKDVDGMLKTFREDHAEMTEDQTKSLSAFMKNLVNGVGSMLERFRKDHGTMSKGVRARLAKEIGEIETYIENKMEEFDKAHTQMSKKQKEDFFKFIKGMKADVKKLVAACRADMADCRNDMHKASTAWRGMAVALAKARNGNPARHKVEAGAMTAIAQGKLKKGKKRGD